MKVHSEHPGVKCSLSYILPQDARRADRDKAKAKSLTPSKQKIAQNQGCICPKCGESLFNGEDLHVHHIEPKQQGGSNSYKNLRFLHLYCHQQVHAEKMTEACGS